MAMKSLSGSTRLIEQVLLNGLQDDGFNIIHKLDLNQMPNYSPVHVLGEPHPFKFQTCVCQTDKDTLSLSVRSWPGNKTSDLSWPVVVEWKVSLINESAENIFDFDPVTTTFIQPTSESPDGQDLTIHLSKIKDLITDNSILLRWNVKLSSQPGTFAPEQEASKTSDEPNITEHMQAALVLAHSISETINSERCREHIEKLKLQLSQTNSDDEKVTHLDARIAEADDRIDKLIITLSEETQKVTELMSDWKDAVNFVQEEAMNSDEGEGLTQTGETDISSDGNTGPMKNRRLNFLLIGEPESGKSATGNSILLKRAFKTGPKLIQPRIQQETVILSNVSNLVTVVEVSEYNLLKNEPTAFQLCPDGFDAIICVDKYNRIIHDNGSVCPFLIHTFIDDDALRAYGVVVITGGDSFEIDHPETTVQEFLRPISKNYSELESKIRQKVILFDNTTTSENKKLFQLNKLLEIVDSLPTGQGRFTVHVLMESLTRILKSKISGLHVLKDCVKIQDIEQQFLWISRHDLSKEWQRMMNSISNAPIITHYRDKKNFYPVKKEYTPDSYNVLIFGRPNELVDTVTHQAEEMGISCQYRHLDLLTEFEEINYFTAIMLVVSCVKLSPEDKDTLRKVIEKYKENIHKIGILIVIDGNLHDNNHKFVEWCNEGNDFFKDMLTACAGRSVLYDYETSDVVLRLEQELNLIKMLHSLLILQQKSRPTESPKLSMTEGDSERDFLYGSFSPLGDYRSHEAKRKLYEIKAIVDRF
ncbi:unnamed protein product [Lymnaea stagnalis]|uniref:AIG1-type G domain-containing protein n=1 Tax=Lymnaea stagnalis TaxID=6523 RepID=A0AAV2H3J3_LYMST